MRCKLCKNWGSVSGRGNKAGGYSSLSWVTRGFNKHRRPTKHVGYFAHRSRLLFSRRKKELVWITLSTKNIIIVKSEWKRNYDVFSERPTGFTLCFSHLNGMFQSIFTGFFTGLRRICWRAKVRNLVFIIILFIACKNWFVTDWSEV